MRDLHDVAIDTARRDPERHRLSMLFPDGLRYRYWKGANKRGQTVRFCHSTTVNAAGYHLIWREVINKTTSKTGRAGKRNQFEAILGARSASAANRRRYEAWKAQQS